MINVKYSIEDEIKRVVSTIKDVDWFIEHGYILEKLTFPKKIEIKKAEFYSEENIKHFIIEEYDVEDYKKNIEFLKNEWLKIEPNLFQKIQKMGVKPKDEYSVCFTKYGTSGSYDMPNSITVNISRRWGVGLLRTIIHEIIHLSIEDLIQKYKIDHWTKERIVDLIFLDFFPELVKIQSVLISTKKIDIIFNEQYPNIKKVITKLSSSQRGILGVL